MGTEPADLLALALSVVRPAAALARSMRAGGVDGVSTKSTDTDVVTAADRAVERQVVAALRAARPDDTFLGEEYGGTTGSSAVRWILDPIDGTVNYMYGLEYAISLAAEVDGVVVAGVVHNAATGHEWTAVLGQGAFRDGQRLACSTETRLAQALLATGFGYDAARRAHQGRVLAEVLPRVRDVRRYGAASIDLCLAAQGSIDMYYEKGLSPWDHAAGGLVATEAGMLVTGLDGEPAGPELLLAAPPALHGELHDLLLSLDASGGP